MAKRYEKGGCRVTLTGHIEHLRTLAQLDPDTTVLQLAMVNVLRSWPRPSTGSAATNREALAVFSGGPGTAALIMLVVVVVAAGAGCALAFWHGYNHGYRDALAYRTAAAQVLDAAATVVDNAKVCRP